MPAIHSAPSSLRSAYRDRVRLFATLLLPALALGALLRLVLYSQFHDDAFRIGHLLGALAMGVVYDLVAWPLALTPVWLALALLRCGWLGRPMVRVPLLAAAIAGLVFHSAAEYYFFEEFNARYNHIALDYLLFPREVFVNIWDSYNVPAVLGAAVGLAALLAWPIHRATRTLQFGPLGFRWRALWLVLVGLATLAGLGALLPDSISQNRITNEVAHNGLGQLWRAFWTAHLDFEAYYHTLPTAEARRRAAQVLGFPEPSQSNLEAPAGAFRQQRRFAPAVPDAGYDVVVILEESFGSEFIGVLGHPERRTSPGFDRWSREGLLLTNLTATGNRTVRGMEGVLCSFPPLPGDSVVKRDHSDHVASLARVMQQKGAETVFFYGGFGIFDSMKSFMTRNGYQEFIEQPDFPKDAFRTIWGVADEWVLGAMLERQKQARQQGKRYCYTALTVSNHKPYYIPRGRIQELTEKPSRSNAVAYADWALADYLDQARAAGLLEHTVVLAVGDHGARVYGAEEIPTPSYRIPALFLHPDPKWRGQRLERLCSQVDLLPTLLSLAGIEFEAPFFGRDLLGLPDAGGRAFVQHNRSVGMLTDEALVILGLQKRIYYYTRSGRGSDAFHRVAEGKVTADLRELAKDVTSVFQTAYELYTNERFQLLDLAPPAGAGASPARPPNAR